MVEKVFYSSGSAFEPLRAYSRAVRVGDRLIISGTVAIDEKGDFIAPGDAYGQTRWILDRIKIILRQTGFSVEDVVRTRLSVTQMAYWEDVAKAHRQVFEGIRPASSIVEVSRLFDPRLLVEIEAEADRSADVSRTEMLTE